MQKQLLIATNNLHKKEEFEQILQGYKIITPGEVNITFDFPENGKSFGENSFGKAQALFSQAKDYLVLADDSGIVVDALGGAPGIYSARYGWEEGLRLNPQEQYELLLKQMSGTNQRTARYVCSLTLILGPYRYFQIQETWEGEIAREAMGNGGFGYDPIFVCKHFNKNAALLTPEDKHKVSHRGKAARTLMNLMEDKNNEHSK